MRATIMRYNFLFNYIVSAMLFAFTIVFANAQTNPLQEENLAIAAEDQNWNYNMGYRFTAEVDGNVTQLGGRWRSGVSHTVRLYSYPAGTQLASVSVTGAGSSTWVYQNISTVSLTAGNQYFVAVRLNSQSSGLYSTGVSAPFSSGGVTVSGSGYQYNSNAMPTNLITATMYGQADITFEPCSYAGNITADDYEIVRGNNTTLTVLGNEGSIQWQSSPDNSSFTNILGATGAVLNTGALDSSMYYRTYITSGACGSDTSESVKIEVIEAFYPLQATNPELTGTDQNWNYNMGYRFTANKDGEITELGGRWRNGVTHTVRLYAYPAGTVLATVNVQGTGDWTYEAITPVSITNGNQYVVAARLNNQSSGYYALFATPLSSVGITITNATYLSNSNAMPTNIVTNYMYGMADIRFEPCDFAGLIVADQQIVETGDSTVLTAVDNTGSIKWQISSDNVSFSDISGATDSTLNTGALTSTTYYRTVLTTTNCGGDTSESIGIEVIDPFHPLQYTQIDETAENQNWNYNMGYRFTALKSGQITELGGNWRDGVAHTVRLYAYPAGTVLASVSVIGSRDWAYTSITPVSITSGNQYVVAVRLDNQSSGVYKNGFNTPVVSNHLNITHSTYRSSSNAMPNITTNTAMYGYADVKFEPCVSGGVNFGDDDQVCINGTTIMRAEGASGTTLQWQTSTDNVSFSNISGANNIIYTTPALTATTYYRLVASSVCGSDTSNVDSVNIIGSAGGQHGLWTGAVSTDWTDACNWDDGQTPSSGDSVWISLGTSSPTNQPAITLSYLEVDNINGFTLSNNLSITQNIVFKTGRIILGASNLTLGANAIITTPTSTSYIQANGTGELRKDYTVADGSTFTYPVGDNSNYTPVFIDLNVGTVLGATPYIAVRVNNSKHPDIGDPTSYTDMYWDVSSNDLSSINYDIVLEYADAKIVGAESEMVTRKEASIGGWVTYNATITSTNRLSATVTADEFGEFTGANSILFISANSGSWLTGATWLGGVTPSNTNDARIQSGHNVTFPSDQNIKSLEVENGGQLTLASNQLTLSGNLIINGDYDETGVVAFNGTSAQTISGDISFYDLVINNASGVSTLSGSNDTIINVLTLTNGVLDVSSGNSFVLLSDASGTARVDAGNGATGTITGDLTFQRYLSGTTEGYRYLSAPVAGQTIADWLDDFDIAISGGTADPWSGTWTSVQWYDESLDGASNDTGWTLISNTSKTLDRGVGYGAYIFQNGYTSYGLGPDLPLTVDLVGATDFSDANFNIQYTDNGDALNDGWNLVANPYPSVLDWTSGTGWTKTNLNNATYIWRADVGQYASYVSGIGTNGGTEFIAPGQAFFVKANAASPGLTINREATSASSTPFFKTIKEEHIMRISLNDGVDESIIRIHEDATEQIDANLDAYKILSEVSGMPNLYTMSNTNSSRLSVNSIGTADVINGYGMPIELQYSIEDTFELDFSGLASFPSKYCITLEDSELNIEVDIRNDSTYRFFATLDSSGKGLRKLVLRINEIDAGFASSVNLINENESVSFNPIIIDSLYEYRWNFGNGTQSTERGGATSTYSDRGTYVVSLNVIGVGCSDSFKDTITVVEPLWVDFKDDNNFISVYPNPTSNNVNIYLEHGVDKMSIYDLAGNELLPLELKRDKSLYSIDISELASGLYYVRVKEGEDVHIIKFSKL